MVIDKKWVTACPVVPTKDTKIMVFSPENFACPLMRYQRPKVKAGATTRKSEKNDQKTAETASTSPAEEPMDAAAGLKPENSRKRGLNSEGPLEGPVGVEIGLRQPKIA